MTGSTGPSAGSAAVPPVRVVRVDAAAVRPLRRAVLRPSRPPQDSEYAADDSALHFAARWSGDGDRTEPVGVATVFPQPHPVTGEPAWRLRGMAVVPAWQGTGIGGTLVRAVLDAVRQAGGSLLWCNARVTAVRFYAHHGFVPDSEVFLVAGRDHRRMRRPL